ncbi:hypothetical protein CLV40_101294 [Actinokineospora auranticolor]|uniref:Uncharacterized protein n=1 Tax=Actinokineospora auranticolor TaxID=155976 RepID=A0A2S6H112_9PSEU|nr:hypothetical protein CLV40_101294 [Actinokineospora auranticolor]
MASKWRGEAGRFIAVANSRTCPMAWSSIRHAVVIKAMTCADSPP